MTGHPMHSETEFSKWEDWLIARRTSFTDGSTTSKDGCVFPSNGHKVEDRQKPGVGCGHTCPHLLSGVPTNVGALSLHKEGPVAAQVKLECLLKQAGRLRLGTHSVNSSSVTAPRPSIHWGSTLENVHFTKK